jgi:CheY-like chemotaxis protein
MRAGNQVVLRVSDTGPGIDPAHVQNLFTPFFTTKEPGSGTGLGLSISFGIAERHGGRLYVERSGEGAVFALSLPVATPAAPAGRARRSSGAIRRPAGLEGPSPATYRSILVVDEDPAMQRMIRALFSREHQTVSTPPTAGDAVRLLEMGRYDLVIADPRAAVSAGEMFADVLTSKWPEHKKRTIMVTADVRPETHEWLRRMGYAYLQKPFRMSDLRMAAERVWEHEDGAPMLPGAPLNAP